LDGTGGMDIAGGCRTAGSAVVAVDDDDDDDDVSLPMTR